MIPTLLYAAVNDEYGSWTVPDVADDIVPAGPVNTASASSSAPPPATDAGGVTRHRVVTVWPGATRG